MISNNATRCRAYGLRTQVFQVLKSFPTKLIGQLWTVLVNLEQLSSNLDIKIIKKILPSNINFIQHYFSNMFFFGQKVLIPSKSSYAARSYCAQKFLKCLKVLIVRVLIVQKSSYCARSYCAHRRIYWTEKY